MDRFDLKAVLRSTGVDLWALIDTAIGVAASDHEPELRARRDGLVARLYAPPRPDRCRNCEPDGRIEPAKDKSNGSPFDKAFGSQSPVTPQSNEDEEDLSIDQQQRRILSIKDSLEDPDRPDEEIAGLLQKLSDTDVTFTALKETDIGRHVNKLRKHPSGEVRGLVKLLVRKWKEIVDEWVKFNSDNSSSPAIITDGDSPVQIQSARDNQNGHGHQVSDSTCSPNPPNGRLGYDEPKVKAMVKREAPAKPVATPVNVKEQKESLLDPDRLASARKRLQENYQEAQNARKQRTVQVMSIDEIPKPKNGFISRNKGGFPAKHW